MKETNPQTIYIRCSSITNDLLNEMRKAEMPHRTRNSQIIYLIHQEAKRLGLDVSDKKQVKQQEKTEEIKSGLQGLAGTKTQANLR